MASRAQTDELLTVGDAADILRLSVGMFACCTPSDSLKRFGPRVGTGCFGAATTRSTCSMRRGTLSHLTAKRAAHAERHAMEQRDQAGQKEAL